MSVVRTQHWKAMELAEEAFEARRQGDERQAVELFRQAFQCERTAAESVARDPQAQEPTRSVLLRSAATLALDCREHREAERLIALALAGSPPAEIVAELRALCDTIPSAPPAETIS